MATDAFASHGAFAANQGFDFLLFAEPSGGSPASSPLSGAMSPLTSQGLLPAVDQPNDRDKVSKIAAELDLASSTFKHLPHDIKLRIVAKVMRFIEYEKWPTQFLEEALGEVGETVVAEQPPRSAAQWRVTTTTTTGDRPYSPSSPARPSANNNVALLWHFDRFAHSTKESLQQFYASLLGALTSKKFISSTAEISATAFAQASNWSAETIGVLRTLKIAAFTPGASQKGTPIEHHMDAFAATVANSHGKLVFITTDGDFAKTIAAIKSRGGVETCLVHNLPDRSPILSQISSTAALCIHLSEISAQPIGDDSAPVAAAPIVGKPAKKPTMAEIVAAAKTKSGSSASAVSPPADCGPISTDNARNKSTEAETSKKGADSHSSKPKQVVAAQAPRPASAKAATPHSPTKPCATTDTPGSQSSKHATASGVFKGRVVSWKSHQNGMQFGFIRPSPGSKCGTDRDLYFDLAGRLGELSKDDVVTFEAKPNPNPGFEGQLMAFNVKKF